MVANYPFISSRLFLTLHLRVVLIFYPLSQTPHAQSISPAPHFFSSGFTFVCPTELLAFNDALPELARLNTTVLGMLSHEWIH
jgi:peroxiredoxin